MCPEGGGGHVQTVRVAIIHSRIILELTIVPGSDRHYQWNIIRRLIYALEVEEKKEKRKCHIYVCEMKENPCDRCKMPYPCKMEETSRRHPVRSVRSSSKV